MSDAATLVELFSSVQGEGPYVGCRQVFLRFHGCNLSCRYCDTVLPSPPAACRVETEPGSGFFRDIGNPVPLAQLRNIVAEWNSRFPRLHHSLSITGGEPLLHAELLTSWLPELREILPIYLETNGTLPDELERVIDHFDYISMDIKLPSVTGLAESWERHREFLVIAVQREVFVKIVVAVGTELDEIGEACELIHSVDTSIPLVLQPVTQKGHPTLPAPRLLGLQEHASRYLDRVRIIPQTHVFLDLP